MEDGEAGLQMARVAHQETNTRKAKRQQTAFGEYGQEACRTGKGKGEVEAAFDETLHTKNSKCNKAVDSLEDMGRSSAGYGGRAKSGKAKSQVQHRPHSCRQFGRHKQEQGRNGEGMGEVGLHLLGNRTEGQVQRRRKHMGRNRVGNGGGAADDRKAHQELCTAQARKAWAERWWGSAGRVADNRR